MKRVRCSGEKLGTLWGIVGDEWGDERDIIPVWGTVGNSGEPVGDCAGLVTHLLGNSEKQCGTIGEVQGTSWAQWETLWGTV